MNINLPKVDFRLVIPKETSEKVEGGLQHFYQAIF